MHFSKGLRAISVVCLFLALAALGTWRILSGTVDEMQLGAWDGPFATLLLLLLQKIGLVWTLVVHSAFWVFMIALALWSIRRMKL